MINNEYVNHDIEKLLTIANHHETLKNKSLLITGGTGLIATYLFLYLDRINKKYNLNLRIYINVRSKPRFQKRVGWTCDEYVILEKNVQDIVSDDILESSLDYIFHLAGSSSPSAIKDTPTGIIKANVDGTFAVLGVAKEKNAKVFYASTREVYGETSGIAMLCETDNGLTDQTLLRSCYPESKRMAENIIISYKHEFDVDYVIARIAHVYGPGMAISNDGRIMSDLVSFVTNKEDIRLISDGKSKRAFCYVSDAINAILTMTLNSTNEIFNLSNETEEIRILDLSKMMVSLFPELNLKVRHIKPDKGQQMGYLSFQRVGLDTTKLEALGWRPYVGLKEGLTNTIQFYF